MRIHGSAHPPRKTGQNLQFLFRVEFFRQIGETGILLQVHYIPVHLQPYYRKQYGFKIGDFPVAEEFYRGEISLPMYYGLKNEEVNSIIRAVKLTVGN